MTAARGDLAVVIVTYNTSELVARCLTSLERGGLDGLSAAVWVVDNASTDGSPAMVAERFPGVRLTVRSDNSGYASANNIALREAGFGPGALSPPFRNALLLNPDTVVPRRALAELAGALESEPDIGAAGPK